MEKVYLINYFKVLENHLYLTINVVFNNHIRFMLNTLSNERFFYVYNLLQS